MSKATWTTREGDTMLIADMETTHIENCIRMLERTMPDHEHDIVETADFPESMWWMDSSFTIPGRKTYKKKIQEFTNELKKRHGN